MSLSQPFANSEQDCMILAATTTCFPLRRKNKLRVIQVANIFYPNFKRSNPKSTWHDLWVPSWFRSFIPPFRPNQQKNTSEKTGGKTLVFFAENFPEVRLPRVIVPACAGACWIAWTGQPQGRSLEGQLWWIGWKVSGEGGENDQGKKRWNWGKKAGEWWWNFRVDSQGIFSFFLCFFWWGIKIHTTLHLFCSEETRCATKRAVFQSGNFYLRSRAKATHQRFFSCFEDVNFPGPTSIKISCVCSSELVHWFDPVVFLEMSLFIMLQDSLLWIYWTNW